MDLVQIMARDLASNLLTPTFLIDPDGILMFYNESAEEILGEKYKDAGELAQDQWGTMWNPEDPKTGEPIPVEELPLSIALSERRPVQRRMCITGMDGVRREIEVLSIPLLKIGEELVGALAVFWEEGDSG
jgi:PAS domain-containing protein